MRAIAKGLTVLAALAVMAACENTGRIAEPPVDKLQGRPFPIVTGTPAVQKAWTSCETDAPMEIGGPPSDALILPRLDTGFAATVAVHCQLEPERRADRGEDLVLTEGRATDLTTLLAALRLPDDTFIPDACTADMPWVPNLLLLDAHGHWIRPGLPTTGCGKARTEVEEAVRALRLTTIKEKVIREILSSGAAVSGCTQEWQDMVAIETSGPTPRALPSHVSLPFEPTSQMRLCVFRVPADRQGTPDVAGTFDYGLLLPEQRREVIARTLASMPPAQECTGPADRFAVLRASNNTGGEIYVELDHCRRILTRPMSGPPTLAQADHTLIELLGR
ncbi:hypothetical protein OG792_08525 [Micromonospora sp. NBC_01699]|uniref:hypothetical protein n=1 Tax=Micromonospora sp. NBC_01699 TaxID=2975984 RepID=UPI002E3795F6|nr:hypothetical protein [Micromonospora sp. NBC_01699]